MIFSFTPAEKTALKVLYESGISDPIEIALPDLILGRGAFYFEQPLKGKEGEIISYKDKSIITINSEIKYEPKKRYISAHELGHFEMHRNLTPAFFDTEAELINWYQQGIHEKEANEFAAELLMPSELFYAESEKKKLNPKLIEDLAEYFQVSKTAALLRYVTRGHYPVMVVCCQNNKMKWFKGSHDFRHYLKFEKDNPPHPGTVAHEIFNTGIAYRKDELQQKITKFDWFEPRSKYDLDSPFFEYCLFLEAYNFCLSLIWEL